MQELYSPTGGGKHAVQLRLQEIERSPAGWLVGSLLEHEDTNVRLFAAIALNLKIERDLDQLPLNELASLRSSLLEWTARAAAAGPRAVLYKLAACVATLSLRTEWPGWLLVLMMRVASPGGDTATASVLVVLSVAIETVARADLVGAKRCVAAPRSRRSPSSCEPAQAELHRQPRHFDPAHCHDARRFDQLQLAV